MEYKISKTIFNKEVILKVTYLWQEDFNINISEDENNYVLSVVSKTGTDFNWDKFNYESFRDWVDNELKSGEF